MGTQVNQSRLSARYRRSSRPRGRAGSRISCVTEAVSRWLHRRGRVLRYLGLPDHRSSAAGDRGQWPGFPGRVVCPKGPPAFTYLCASVSLDPLGLQPLPFAPSAVSFRGLRQLHGTVYQQFLVSPSIDRLFCTSDRKQSFSTYVVAFRRGAVLSGLARDCPARNERPPLPPEPACDHDPDHCRVSGSVRVVQCKTCAIRVL